MKISMSAGFGAVLLTCRCFLVAAQGKPERTEPSSVYAELEKAPAKYRTKANPLQKDPEAVSAGKVLFEEHCVECHGENAVGSKKAPSLRAKEVQEAPPGTLFWILTNGIVRRGMPVWSKLPEPQRWQLITYIQSLGPAESKENKPAGKP
jgi:mono/diheme cytochrome c family protein